MGTNTKSFKGLKSTQNHFCRFRFHEFHHSAIYLYFRGFCFWESQKNTKTAKVIGLKVSGYKVHCSVKSLNNPLMLGYSQVYKEKILKGNRICRGEL